MENKIGDKILEVRNRRNLTQEELAEKVGTVASYISNIERKNKCPSLSLLRKLVKELDTSYDYLLMDDFNMDKKLEIKYREMFKEIQKLDEKTQEEFFVLADNIIKSFKNIEKNVGHK
jgi:transcriptional regulator with XRE-family HTH domain